MWQGGYYALPLAIVTAIFKTDTSRKTESNSDLDIEIHKGLPVFMQRFSTFFEAGSFTSGDSIQEELNWALILNLPGRSLLGCRVHQVLGPFWDELKSESVKHDGHDWALVQVREGLHA